LAIDYDDEDENEDDFDDEDRNEETAPIHNPPFFAVVSAGLRVCARISTEPQA